MIYACYFVPREGVHPHAKLSDYEHLWKIMHRSLRKLGHKLVHITDLHTESWGDSEFRIDVDPATTVYSRDVAWAEFVRRLPDGEEACMVEPDTIMLRDIPPIQKGADCVILRRPEKVVPGWFKLAKNTAAPLYDAVVRAYDHFPDHFRAFHGDIKALHYVLGFAPGQRAHTIPHEVGGVKIESRNWVAYGSRSPNTDSYLLQFKGISKKMMLRLA